MLLLMLLLLLLFSKEFLSKMKLEDFVYFLKYNNLFLNIGNRNSPSIKEVPLLKRQESKLLWNCFRIGDKYHAFLKPMSVNSTRPLARILRILKRT